MIPTTFGRMLGLAAALAALAIPGPAAAKRAPAALLDACAACHGPDGAGQGAIPPFAGLEPEAFATAMRAFKAGEGDATVMPRIAAGLTDEDIAALAAYLAEREGRR
jgi:cytochrome c553